MVSEASGDNIKAGVCKMWKRSSSVYRRCEVTRVLIMVLVHVDDCTIMGKNLVLVEWFKVEIAKYVEITDMGALHWILGIEVHCIQEEKRLLHSQKTYIDSILWQYGLEDLKPVSMPMDPASWLSSIQSPLTTEELAAIKHIPYHEAVGSLMYATLGTCPDICYAVQTVSKFNNKPRLSHWEAVKWNFQYLISTENLWLGYRGLVKELQGYVDADGSMGEDCKAVSGLRLQLFYLYNCIKWFIL